MKSKSLAIITAILVLVLCLTINVSAQQRPVEEVTVPKDMLTPTQIQDLQVKKEANNLKDRIDTYGKWVGMGDEIGRAVDGSLKSITTNAVELSETNLGRFTMFLVAWKVIGTDAIQLVIGLLFAIVWIPIFIWSYQKMCIPKRMLVEDGPDEKAKRWEVINEDNDDTKITHLVVFLVMVIANVLIIFV